MGRKKKEIKEKTPAQKFNEAFKTVDDEPDDHGLAEAYESGPPENMPTFVCLCGDTFEACSWADAGSDFDAHLQERLGP